MRAILILLTLGVFYSISSGCKKILNTSPPVGTVLTTQVFSSDAQATAAARDMYYKMINASLGILNTGMPFFTGMASDELISFNQTNANYIQFQQNTLASNNSNLTSNIWGNLYSVIYVSNSIIEGLKNYSGVSDSVKNELIGEAEFVRAFCDFYLINLFGAIPLVTTINYDKTSLLYRTPASQVYNAMIVDLVDAQRRLPGDYSVGSSERTIPNKWAATALLSRIYLYTNDYKDAENEASMIISNNSLFTLTSLDNVFLKNSSEAIWQLQQTSAVSPNFNITPDGYYFIPRVFNSSIPFAYLTPQLLSSFEPGDNRRLHWVDSTKYRGVMYYIPYKYKSGPAQAQVNGTSLEYYMVFRLAEQFLIRAEAEAQLGDSSDAIADLNTLRARANLGGLTGPMSQSALLNAVMQERRIELFSEWGNRWLDLIRTNAAHTILSPIKAKWVDSDVLFPIPLSELISDPNLTQNSGYN